MRFWSSPYRLRQFFLIPEEQLRSLVILFCGLQKPVSGRFRNSPYRQRQFFLIPGEQLRSLVILFCGLQKPVPGRFRNSPYRRRLFFLIPGALPRSLVSLFCGPQKPVPGRFRNSPYRLRLFFLIPGVAFRPPMSRNPAAARERLVLFGSQNRFRAQSRFGSEKTGTGPFRSLSGNPKPLRRNRAELCRMRNKNLFSETEERSRCRQISLLVGSREADVRGLGLLRR